MSVGHDGKSYVELIDARIRERIAQECALEVLREVMVHGCINDLNEVQAKYGIVLDSTTSRGLLYDMVEVSSLENLQWLVTHLVDINVINGCGETVLMLKIINGRREHTNWSEAEKALKEAITKLLALGTDCRIANNAGNTALHLLVDRYYYWNHNIIHELIGMLIDHGADCRAANNAGNTALHLLVDNHYFYHDTAQEPIRLLVSHGADLNAKNADGKTVLKFACNERMADFILRQPECKPAHRKLNRAVIINKNNFRSDYIFRWCQQSGAIKAAMSRIEEAALDSFIQLPHPKSSASEEENELYRALPNNLDFDRIVKQKVAQTASPRAVII